MALPVRPLVGRLVCLSIIMSSMGGKIQYHAPFILVPYGETTLCLFETNLPECFFFSCIPSPKPNLKSKKNIQTEKK